MADRNDIRISNNADWAGSWTLRNADDDTPRNLTGATFEMDIRATADAVAEEATLTTGNGRVTLSGTPTDGVVYIMIPKAVAAALALGVHYHDMLLNLGGVSERVWYGTLTISEGVSR